MKATTKLDCETILFGQPHKLLFYRKEMVRKKKNLDQTLESGIHYY